MSARTDTMHFLRRYLLILGLLLAVATFLSSCVEVPSTMAPGGFGTVVIDAGHGGHDSGERSRTGLVEKDLTLDTALRLQPLLAEAGYHTVMSRSTDTFVELNDRVALANAHPDAILVSIHYNASPSSGPHGIETFFWQPGSYGLALRVQRHLVEETGLDNRGVTRRVLRLTHDPHVPSILAECGFLTNSTEAGTVRDPDFRQRVAEGLAAGIIDQQEHGDVGIGNLPPLVVDHGPSRHHYHRVNHHYLSRHRLHRAGTDLPKKKKRHQD